MTRIVIVNLEGNIAGAQRSLLLLLKYLHRDFTLAVACPCRSPLSEALRAMRIDCYPLPDPPRRYSSVRSIPYWVRTAFDVARIALRAKSDVIHANSFKAGVASLPATVTTGKKLIMHARDFSRGGFLFRLCSRHCAKIVAVSQAVKNNLVRHGAKAEDIEVVYNGVDETSAAAGVSDKTSLHNAKGGDNHEFIFAQVGQLVPWKNHNIFLAAAARVAKTLPHARFVLVGDDIFGRDSKYKTSLLQQIKDRDIAERFNLMGWQDNMHQVWPRIGCLVHTAESEPFGRAIIEAMAHKVPVIAVSSAGPSEIIENGKTGILLEVGDTEGLSQAMLRIARDNESAEEMAEAGYRHVVSNLTADKTAAHTAQIYKEVLAG
ncbi:MAG: glycosyltransferase family 4 protein [Planctomycetota bacterium]|jgi:glycosyltransferase involved in cell wall biosynthesis